MLLSTRLAIIVVALYSLLTNDYDACLIPVMGYSADSLPHVGDVPGKPGQFILAGFNGHGMPVGFLAAKGLSEMICHSSSYEATGLPRLFQTSHARLESMLDDILDSGGEAGEISTQKSEAAQSRDSPTFDVNAVKII